MIEIEQSLLDEPIKKFMIRHVISSNSNETINEVIKKIIKTGHRRLPIIKKQGLFNKNKVVGIITAMDMLDAYLRNIEFNRKIEEIMVRDVIFCYEDERLKNVIKKFQFSRRGGFPVLNSKKELAGIITEKDIVNILKKYDITLPVSHFMTKKPFIIKPQNFFTSLVILVNTRYRKLPILDENNNFIGIFTDRISLKTITENQNLKILKNTDFCLKDIIKLDTKQKINEAINIMSEKNIGGLPVFEGKKLEGFVTERDIIEKIKIT